MWLPFKFLGQRKYAIGLVIEDLPGHLPVFCGLMFQVFWASLPLPSLNERATLTAVARWPAGPDREGEDPLRRSLLIVGFIALALGLLWIGQGTGAIAWPQSSFMINQIQWAGYGAALAALGLILIWQGKR
jgi:hypothetical protein